jgi:hypothetical protein
MCDVDLGKPARLSGSYRAKRLFMFTQAKARAEFSWPFGPSASRQDTPSTSVILRPEGHESIAQVLARVRFLATIALKGSQSAALNPAGSVLKNGLPAEWPFLVGSRERKEVARLETRIFSISKRKPITGQRTAEGSAVRISLES